MKNMPENDANMGLEAAANLLISNGWLSTLNSEHSEAILDSGSLRKTAAGEQMPTNAQTNQYLYAVVSGWQDVFLPRLNGDLQLVNMIGPATWVGGLTAISKEPQHELIVNRTDCILLYLDDTDIAQMLQKHPLLLSELTKLGLEKLDVLVAALLAQAEPSAEKKICLTLLRLIGPTHEHHYEAGRFRIEIPLSQNEVAQLTMMSRNSVGAVFKQLEAEGVLALKYKKIIVQDFEALIQKV